MTETIDQKDVSASKRSEFEDLQNEIAGRETGRRARFLRDGPNSEAAKKKERETRDRELARLAQLLNDPVYRAKYDGVLTLLTEAEQATESAIAHLTQQIDAAQNNLNDLLDRSARLPDGTRVFRDANGTVRREDGTLVEDHLADTILWNGIEPSFEDMQSSKDRLNALKADLEQATDYLNDVLGPSRDHIEDPDNPPSLNDLDDIEADILSRMPTIVREHMPQAHAAAPEVSTQSIGLPTLGG